MLGCQHHERCAEQGVRSGSEHAQRPGVGGEPHRCPLAAPDPVALHVFDGVWPVQPVEVGQQSVTVRGDPHLPLAQVPLEHREVADVAAVVGGDLLVGQHRAQARAPVDQRVGQVRQPVVVDDSALVE